MKIAFYSFCCFLLFTATVSAQKLPSTQDNGLKAPDKVLIDGKITEWGTQLQAYNYATDIYYSVANDHDKLYIVVQAKSSEAIKKIIGGNITFSVMADSKTPKAVSPSLIFPLLKIAVKSNLGIKYNSRVNINGKDEAARLRQRDSLLTAINTELNTNCKEIKLGGMKGTTDSLISVYNGDGFKAAMAFDKQFLLNYELAIPLASLGLSIESNPFIYKICVNGVDFSEATHVHTLASGDRVTVTSSPRSITMGGGSSMDAMSSATYLKAVYTLAK